MNAYAGIGARITPPEVLILMQKVGKFLAKEGFTLRSGGAKGADTAFEQGCDEVGGAKEIFLPWKCFNGHSSKLYGHTQAAYKMAKLYHPKWEFLLPTVREMMARNSHQVLGLDLNDPVKFICCWTKNGMVDGGTGQALRIANALKIPIVNFGSMKLPEVDLKIRELI